MRLLKRNLCLLDSFLIARRGYKLVELLVAWLDMIREIIKGGNAYDEMSNMERCYRRQKF